MLLNIVVSLILAIEIIRDYDFYSHHNIMVSAMLIGAFLMSVVSEGISFQVATSGVKLRGKKAVVRVMTVPETEPEGKETLLLVDERHRDLIPAIRAKVVE
jgi:hypothetical protein